MSAARTAARKLNAARYFLSGHAIARRGGRARRGVRRFAERVGWKFQKERGYNETNLGELEMNVYDGAPR